MNKSILWLVIFSSPGYSAVVVDAFNSYVGDYLGSFVSGYDSAVSSRGYRFTFDRINGFFIAGEGPNVYRTVYFQNSSCAGIGLVAKDISPGVVFPVRAGSLYYLPAAPTSSTFDVYSVLENGVCSTLILPMFSGYDVYTNDPSVSGVPMSLMAPLSVVGSISIDQIFRSGME